MKIMWSCKIQLEVIKLPYANMVVLGTTTFGNKATVTYENKNKNIKSTCSNLKWGLYLCPVHLGMFEYATAVAVVAYKCAHLPPCGPLAAHIGGTLVTHRQPLKSQK